MSDEIKNAFAAAWVDGPSSDPTKPDKRTIRAIGPVIDNSIAEVKNLASQGVHWVTAVRVASTANIVIASGLEAGDIIDGVTLVAGDRVLLKDQTSVADNGVWVAVASGTASRSSDANEAAELLGLGVYVTEGTANRGRRYVCAAGAPITIGSTVLPFVLVDDQSPLIDQVNEIGEATDDINLRTAPINRNVPVPFQSVTNDPSSRVVFGVLTNGFTRLLGAMIGKYSRIAEVCGIGKFALMDRQGRAAVSLDRRGRLNISRLKAKELDFDYLAGGAFRNYPSDLRRKPDGYGLRLAAEDVMVGGFGQSNIEGFNAAPALTTAAKYSDALMFNGGVRPDDLTGSSASQHASYVAMAEAAANGNGETPMSGMVQMIRQMLIEDGQLNVGDHRYRQIGVAFGTGSMSINKLISGPNWQKVVDAMTFGKAISNAAGRTIDMPAVLISQSESDTEAGTPAALWKAMISECQGNFTDLRRSQFGSDELVKLIIRQTASFYQSGDPTAALALAQEDLAEQQPGIIMAGPGYQYDYNDGYHMSNLAQLLSGALAGYVYYLTVIKGQMWSPLRMIGAKRQGSRILVDFHVPKPPIVIATDVTADIAGKGFSIIDPTGASIAISSVVTTGPAQLAVQAAATVPVGSWLTLGINGTSTTGRTAGSRTNIRDSQGDTIKFDRDGRNARLDNFAIISKRRLTN